MRRLGQYAEEKATKKGVINKKGKERGGKGGDTVLKCGKEGVGFGNAVQRMEEGITDRRCVGRKGGGRSLFGARKVKRI